MKFLLDTQAFLWFVLKDCALSQVACDLIVDPLNDILLSPATIGKLLSKLVLVSIKFLEIVKGTGDWGLGIRDWVPNP